MPSVLDLLSPPVARWFHETLGARRRLSAGERREALFLLVHLVRRAG